MEKGNGGGGNKKEKRLPATCKDGLRISYTYWASNEEVGPTKATSPACLPPSHLMMGWRLTNRHCYYNSCLLENDSDHHCYRGGATMTSLYWF